MSAFLQQQQEVVETTILTGLEVENVVETYPALTVHCLQAGNYLRPSSSTIETLVLNFVLEQHINVDIEMSNWALLGVNIHLAFRMGLHRDPSHWEIIRPLQAELRRRAWITLYQTGFFRSTQMGLPRIIKDSQCDARPPAHFLDRDIGPGDTQVPPERPLRDPTPLLFVIQRHALIKFSAKIYVTEAASVPSPVTISELAVRLEAAIANIPEWLRYKSL